MTWDYFVPFSIAALHFWGFGAFAAWRGRKPYVVGGLTLIGLAIFFCFIVGMWISLERPPMRTHGRDAPVVLFLSSTGRTHHIQPLEV